jgi:hypothetical protein
MRDSVLKALPREPDNKKEFALRWDLEQFQTILLLSILDNRNGDFDEIHKRHKTAASYLLG